MNNVRILWCVACKESRPWPIYQILLVVLSNMEYYSVISPLFPTNIRTGSYSRHMYCCSFNFQNTLLFGQVYQSQDRCTLYHQLQCFSHLCSILLFGLSQIEPLPGLQHIMEMTVVLSLNGILLVIITVELAS